jgi:kinesin family protein 6/9
MTNLVTANTSGAMSVDSKSADGSSDSSQSNISSASSSVTMMSFSDEPRLRAELDHHKAVYKEAFQRLRDLKAEIEKIQRVLEGGRLKMQSDFEAWYSDCLMKLSKLTQNETQKLVNRGASTQPSLNLSAPSSTGSGGAASTTQGVMMAMPPPQGMMMPNMLMPPMMGGHMLPPTFSQGNMMMNGPPPPNMQMPMGMMMMPPQGLPPGFPPNMMMPLGFQQPMPLPLGAATRQAKQPSSSSSSSSSSANTSFESTGSDSADADIQAFYKAKQLLAGAMGGGGLAQPPHTR